MKYICIPNNSAEPFIAEFIGFTENNFPLFNKNGEIVFFGGATIEYKDSHWELVNKVGNDKDILFNFLRDYNRSKLDKSKKISWDEAEAINCS